MDDNTSSTDLSLAQALGRVPSGLFILTARSHNRDTGMLVSWVQQAGFTPPMLTVAVRRDRPAAEWVTSAGRFALNQIAAGQKRLVRHFARGFAPDEPAFDGLPLGPENAFGILLAEALAYLECEVTDHIDAGDHRVFVAQVVGGAMIQASAEPMVHVRHNGFHY
jgi:flavin reductase (DIM6/NTAB) family NADH-FMN oxidoreductase RutF